MTPKINQKLEELRQVMKDELNDHTTSVKIFINSQGVEMSESYRTPEELKRDGVSMRNIRGEFIK